MTHEEREAHCKQLLESATQGDVDAAVAIATLRRRGKSWSQICRCFHVAVPEPPSEKD